MDSKTLYIAGNKQLAKIRWINADTNEWQYCGAGNEVKWDVVHDALSAFFETSTLVVVLGRNDSFATGKADVVKAIETLVGNRNFFIWSEDFQKVTEFKDIGVFRTGIAGSRPLRPAQSISYNTIKAGSPDKVKGKPVKYKRGDCLSLDCNNGSYLGVLVSEKFNKYYDFTLLEYFENRKPQPEDFLKGRVFGNYAYGGTFADNAIATERLMLPCLEIDVNPGVEIVCSVTLIESIGKSSYGYRKDISEILQHYLSDLPQRLQNTKNFDERPGQIFISKRLIPVIEMIQ